MACSIDQSQLIRTRCIIGDIIISLLITFHICDDCVTQAKRFMEAFQVLVILVIYISDVLVEIRVLKIYIRHTRGIVEWLRIIFAVLIATR